MSNRQPISTFLGIVAGAMLATSGSAYPSLIAASFPPIPPFDCGCIDGVDGFEFIPNTDILVTKLGWYDHDEDGLTRIHPVAIFDVVSQSIISPVATITTASALESGFRYESIAPVLLTAGQSYAVLGSADGPPFDPYVLVEPTLACELQFVQGRSQGTAGGELVFVTGSSGSSVYFGPNFQFEPQPTCPTDINGDGSTNVLDLIDLLLCFGQPSTPPCETGQDVNCDGTVNVLDLIELLLQFGQACP